MQGIAAQHKCSDISSWHHVVQTYWRRWTELHPPVGLVQLPQGDVAIVRGGHMLTLLQKADPLAASYQTHSPVSDSTAQAGQAGDLPLLQQCVELLHQLLGQNMVNLFVHLWTQPPAGVSLHAIGCAFVEVLATGPQLSSPQDQPQAADSRDALRQWRQQRSSAILRLGHIISQMTSGTPVQALRDYITLITPAANQAPATPMHSSANMSPISGHALTIMLRQNASQQLQAASHILLLAWLDSLRAAGALHITAAVSNALRQEIAPQLEAHIRCTTVTQWLCTATAAALPDDEAARIKHSELSSKLASLDFVSGGKQEASRQQRLAELFLPDFVAQHGGEIELWVPVNRGHLHLQCSPCTCIIIIIILTLSSS